MRKSTKCAEVLFVVFLGVSSYVMYKSIDQLSDDYLNNCCFASLEFDIVFHVLVQCRHLFVPAFPTLFEVLIFIYSAPIMRMDAFLIPWGSASHN